LENRSNIFLPQETGSISLCFGHAFYHREASPRHGSFLNKLQLRDQKSSQTGARNMYQKLLTFVIFLGLCGKLSGQVCSYFFKDTRNLVAAQMVLALPHGLHLTLSTNEKL
jgi:hypothetical protein